MSILARKQGIGMAALLLAASTILSRFMGLIRDKVISWQFGAGSESDIYFAAFVVPDILNYLLAGGFLGITLMPLLARRFAEDEKDGWVFFSSVLSWMACAALLLTAVAMVFAEPLSRLVAPGLAEEKLTRLQFFMRITLPAQFFFLTGSCVTALLFLRKQFVVPALAPLIYNGCIILFGVSLPALGLAQGMSGYCVGVVAGAALGTLLLPLSLVRKGGFPFQPNFRHPLLKRFLLLALPLMLGQTITALDEQFLRVFGSLTGDGSVSLLNYAKRVAMVPVALVGQAAALASYPFLVSLLAKGDREGFCHVLGKALRTGTGLILPLALWMAVLAPSTFTFLFYGGRMADAEIMRAAPLLQLLLCASPFWVLLELLTRGYYAQTDTLTPALTGTVLTLLFLPVYYWLAVPAGADGIALTSVTSLACYSLLLIAIWLKREGGAVFAGIGRTAVTSLVCALPGTVLGYFLDSLVRDVMSSFSPILAAFAGLSLAGLALLFTWVPLVLRFCPELLDRLKSRLSRKKA